MLLEPALTLTIPSISDGTVLDCRVFHPDRLLESPHGIAERHRHDHKPPPPPPQSQSQQERKLREQQQQAGTELSASSRVRHVNRHLDNGPWRPQSAIVAHPYAPLGGCHDNPVVNDVAAQLLRKGFVVGTFNFRGAGGSAGRTSWTSKAERMDYASFVGFMVYYMHCLGRGQTGDSQDSERADFETAENARHNNDGTDEVTQHKQNEEDRPLFLMAGYSYGSIVATQMPPLETILETFASPPSGSHAAQIRLRAESLANQQITAFQEALPLERTRAPRTGHSREPSSPSRMDVRVGGTEGVRGQVGDSPGDSPTRKSRDGAGEDGRRRRAMSDLLAKTKRVGRHPPPNGSSVSPEKTTLSANGVLPVVSDLVVPRSAFLLISPVPGLVTRLLTLNLLPSFGRNQGISSSSNNEADDNGHGNSSYEQKLARHRTLVVYGDSDTFVSVAKMRSWAERIRSISMAEQGGFHAEEIETAGHFWIEEGVLDRMLGFVSLFAQELVNR